MTPRHSLAIILTCAALAPFWPALPSAAAGVDFATAIQPAFENHCVRCHGKDGKVKGKVNLLELDRADKLAGDPELLEELIAVLKDGEMPPEDEAQPTAAEREELLGHLKQLFEATVGASKDFPRIPLRRMTRFQYNNAVQDLFELTPVVFTLPERMLRDHSKYFQPAEGTMPDTLKAGSRPLGKSQLIEKRLAGVAAFPQDLRAEHGFDNRGDHLSLSPLLLESFLVLSRSILESPDFTEKNCGIWPTFFAPPDSSKAPAGVVRKRLHAFLSRAFRRPVDDALLDRYTTHVTGLLAAGEDFTTAMKAAASAAIASPRFLYLYDDASSATAKGSETVDDFELASRLSFFLWGSIPDDELLDLAIDGKLHDPAVLTAQVDRMLADPKVKRFCDSFPSQWLQLERIVSSLPDREHHPEFYFGQYRISMHMMLEPLLLFETVLIENRPILDFIDSDYTYRSSLLTHWYRHGTQEATRPPPATIPFTRVALTDRREGGLITTAAVMTMTSNPDRTQPITRGAWIAGVIFNDPPEPPPADVPELPEDGAEEEKNLTLRERFAAHRERPDCAGCHTRLDPLGFAFENYGPTGLWRDRYENGREVDASGILFKKHEFTDPIDFKDAILAESDRFVRGFAAHLLSYALGREISPADSPSLDKILAESAKNDHRMRPLLRQIATSEPFLYKSNPKGAISD